MTVATQAPARQSSSVPSPGASTVAEANAWSRKPAAAPRLACQYRDRRRWGGGRKPGLSFKQGKVWGSHATLAFRLSRPPPSPWSGQRDLMQVLTVWEWDTPLPNPSVLTWAVLTAAWRDTTPSARWDRVVLHSLQGLGAIAPRVVVNVTQEGDPKLWRGRKRRSRRPSPKGNSPGLPGSRAPFLSVGIGSGSSETFRTPGTPGRNCGEEAAS